MELNIMFTDGSSKETTLVDDFEWNKIDKKTDGNTRDTNLDCLIYDYSIGKGREMLSYSFSNNGKILKAWKSQLV